MCVYVSMCVSALMCIYGWFHMPSCIVYLKYCIDLLNWVDYNKNGTKENESDPLLLRAIQKLCVRYG